jgi:Xaa-Pro aminopeptidase
MPLVELERRRDETLAAMQRMGVDVAAFTDPESVCYLAGSAAPPPPSTRVAHWRPRA